jgi:hypothetical protein
VNRLGAAAEADDRGNIGGRAAADFRGVIGGVGPRRPAPSRIGGEVARKPAPAPTAGPQVVPSPGTGHPFSPPRSAVPGVVAEHRTFGGPQGVCRRRTRNGGSPNIFHDVKQLEAARKDNGSGQPVPLMLS